MAVHWGHQIGPSSVLCKSPALRKLTVHLTLSAYALVIHLTASVSAEHLGVSLQGLEPICQNELAAAMHINFTRWVFASDKQLFISLWLDIIILFFHLITAAVIASICSKSLVLPFFPPH